jgi:hypothetical protein
MTDVLALSGTERARLIRDGEVSAAELVDAHTLLLIVNLNRIDMDTWLAHSRQLLRQCEFALKSDADL